MAECSYARCVLERRAIRKSLQSWTKTMVHIVGLERVAEELMGRRKWRQYQKLVLSHEEDYSMEAKDWEPSDKCNLCPEHGDQPPPPHTDTSLPRPPSEESASSASASADDSGDRYPARVPAMTTLESVASSMAASLAAVAALSQGKPPVAAALYPPPPGLFPWYLAAPEPKPSPPVPEQPLDLSKSSSRSPEPIVETPPSHQHLVPSSPSLKVPAALNRLYKAKPRLSAVAGRRTYTEDELQAALRDIQSGKLGTRRAAVIYGIPRSTLRNKVYKLAMERERDSHLVLAASPDHVAAKARALLGEKDDDDLQDDEDDKDSGAEEEREVEKALMRPIISIEDFMRLSSESAGFPGTDSLRTLLQHGSKYLAEKKEDGSSSPPVYPVFPSPGSADLWNGLDHAALGPYINRLLNANPIVHPNHFAMTGNRHSPTERSPTDSPGDFVPKLPHLELVRRMIIEDRLAQEEQQKKEKQFLNGSRLGEPGPSSSIFQEDEHSGSGTPPNVILKIPSFKPMSKNGIPGETSGFPLGVKIGESSQHSVISPPISTGRSESSSPPSMGKGINVSLKDVISKSIIQKYQQSADLHHLSHTPPGLEHFRRADFSQPLGCSPPITRNHNNNHLDERKMHVPTSKPQISGSNTSTTTGGKGTRPKRGKYRNYDRDSLVEAVRAVQRGEMSVHRAGSYYGVPHSTLEYKVKERHLMRPRKREPKSVQEEIKLKEDPIVSRIPPPVDKSKLLPPTKPPKTPFTPPSTLPTGPNGLKMSPMFDPSLPYSAAPPFPFWPPNPFPHLPMDYPRNPNFPPTPDHFFASQMIQRLQEDSARMPHSPPPTLGKTERELAETLYDGTGANGSFLDGIIRSSLESGLPKNKDGELKRPEQMSNKALLDQLCRNSRMTPVPKAETSSSDDEKTAQKRPCEDTPSAHLEEVKEEVNKEVSEERDPSPRPEQKIEPESEEKPDDSNLKTDNVDESACDSNHTIKRVKLEEET
ncbi:mushroom body large-type Kenyon cell-specific protein 1 isoform X2 [Homalodisca vitripennis]|uniref:mushroom body large-type Kenyon cell-specific protein 1 isoform X2 n=1 Tax=Homalodisca vitripennis TaxID=197043 RepID=UPI001EEB0312|nr:mushroom body large-type Kenyon cell-specific protein 1 isoform X2 [Homalodisca vitripennis]